MAISVCALVLVAVDVGASAAAPLTKRSPPLPPFRSSVAPVTRSELRYSWRTGCPVPPSALRLVQLSFYGFDHRPHVGTMIVNASVVPAVRSVFSRLYAARFPIRRMIPVDYFHGSDPASMAADNTSGFNCRRAVTTGPPQWSVHAYG
ncbi:MAG TPA: hypothetical protein VKR27_04765, partial [Acidimicrobiales bacterium]|nr:hypothetical protein [Acidimicrobiales bacterium]